jgi:glutamate racemase
MGTDVTLVDSQRKLRAGDQKYSAATTSPSASEKGNRHYFVTDVPAGFIRPVIGFSAKGDVHQISLGY